MNRALTREEAKLITRRRLLEAAAKVLRETGYGGLSASAVAREAGVAQPTFYVHFQDKDDLVRTLAQEKVHAFREPLQRARARIAASGVEAIRETFRLPIEAMLADPELFRLYVQQSYDPASPFGEQARKLHRELEADLVEDLARLGAPAKTRKERERLEMMAQGMIALAETLALAHLDGRYRHLDAVVDVLTRFALGAMATLEQ